MSKPLSEGNSRLLKLAELLRGPMPKGLIFNLNDYCFETECGTVCCAVGWAALSGRFEGLLWTNCIEYFDLSETERTHLFIPRSGYSSPTKEEVADRIESLVMTRCREPDPR
jgi:hypothetical protein